MRSVCRQTVTVYRKTSLGVTRQVVKNCSFQRTDSQQDNNLGKAAGRAFLLIVPGGRYIPRPGDRVLEGIGPAKVDWDRFLPCTTDALGEVAYVEPWYLNGKLHHYEAGAGSAR